MAPLNTFSWAQKEERAARSDSRELLKTALWSEPRVYFELFAFWFLSSLEEADVKKWSCRGIGLKHDLSDIGWWNFKYTKMSAYLLPDQVYGNDSLVVNSMPTMPHFYDDKVAPLEDYELVCSSSDEEFLGSMSHLTAEEVGAKRTSQLRYFALKYLYLLGIANFPSLCIGNSSVIKKSAIEWSKKLEFILEDKRGSWNEAVF